ncbi:MAG TPA: fibronectin type III domain-containing protein [Actinokineospora sp.]|nr:fibronectin type III domain-containing protein [Actinokineospora sp.]
MSKRGRGRESASFGAAALGVLLLAGAALGNGISRTAVEVSDGLTWLADEQRGEVVQVNPASGRPETRLQVSGSDSQLDITQKDGVLIVLDRRTGQITVIDLATLLASGRRQAPPGGSSKVLLVDGRLYIIDRASGTVVNADPITLADIGAPWLAGLPLADAVTDESGVLWVVDHGGTLRALEWSEDEGKFVEKSERSVSGAGPLTALVPHERGVTLLGLEGGVVLRDGTGEDLTASTARQDGDVLAAQTSPTGLAPASIPGAGTVVLVSGTEVLRVDVASLGCAHPGRPVVYRDKIYVPCKGTGRVIVLDRGGRRGGDDVRTNGSGDPQLVFDDGRLFINAPGAETGVIVDADGSTRSVVIRSPELQVTNPDRSPPPSPPSPPRPNPSEPTRTRPNQPTSTAGATTTDVAPGSTGPSGSPAPTTSTSGTRTGGAPGVPPGVAVSLNGRTAGDVTVDIRWGAATDNGSPITGYVVTARGGFAGSTKTAQVAGTSTTMVLSCSGNQFCQNGRLDVSVVAVNQVAQGAAGTAVWSVPQPTTTQPQPTTTTQPVPTTTTQAPPTTTTTQPPPTTTTPPPPAPVPTAGAVVISGATKSGYTAHVTMAPPSDWANHDGTCEVVNKTYGYSEVVACSATSAAVAIDEGTNAIVIRATARDGSRSVDSASRTVRIIVNECQPGRICPVQPLVASDPVNNEVSSGPMVGAGVGLLATAALLRFGVRRREEEEDDKQ